jgi:hypothetical protein
VKGCIIGIITGLGSLIIDSSVLTNMSIIESICIILSIMLIWGYFGFMAESIINNIWK